MFSGGISLCFVSGGALEGVPGLYVQEAPSNPASFVKEVDSIGKHLLPIRRSRLIWFQLNGETITQTLTALRSLGYFVALTTNGEYVPTDLQLYNLVRVHLTSEEWVLHGCHELQVDISSKMIHPTIPNGFRGTPLVTATSISQYLEFAKSMPGSWRLCRKNHRIVTLVEAGMETEDENPEDNPGIDRVDPVGNGDHDNNDPDTPLESEGRTELDQE